MFVTKQFTFDSAHYLTDYHGKCERMHGHTYKLQVTVEGPVMQNGLVVDFVDMKKVVKEFVLEKLDHNVLNDVVKNPSAEHLAMWIWEQLKDYKWEGNDDAALYEVKLWETANSWVTYRGE